MLLPRSDCAFLCRRFEHVSIRLCSFRSIKMGGDESHFSVSLFVKDKVTRQCPQATTLLKPRKESRTSLKPVLNWANVCSPNILEHSSDSSTNYDSFLN